MSPEEPTPLDFKECSLYRAKAKFPIAAEQWFVIDLHTAEVMLEEPPKHPMIPAAQAVPLEKPPLGRRPFLDDGKDLVNHPSHYNTGRIEVIEFIEDQQLGYNLGNTVKYISRAGKKDPTKEIQDLEKAAWYLKRQIEIKKAEALGRAVVRPNDMVKS